MEPAQRLAQGGPGGDPRTQRFVPHFALSRWPFVVSALAIAGAAVCVGQIGMWYSIGAWPPHDTANIWLAGRHLVEDKPVYTGLVTGFLVFVYSPPIAVVAAPLSIFPIHVLSIILLLGQVLAFRWIAGSWTSVGLWSWLPVVPRELVTGNVDFLVAAAIYAGVLRIRGSGYVDALFAFVKFSPALAVTRWREFALGTAALLAISIPWLDLWPEWIRTLLMSLSVPTDTLPLLPRLPLVALLLLVRRPWSIAAAAAFATPAFYFHSWVLLLPAVRLSPTFFGRDRPGTHRLRLHRNDPLDPPETARPPRSGGSRSRP